MVYGEMVTVCVCVYEAWRRGKWQWRDKAAGRHSSTPPEQTIRQAPPWALDSVVTGFKNDRHGEKAAAWQASVHGLLSFSVSVSLSMLRQVA